MSPNGIIFKYGPPSEIRLSRDLTREEKALKRRYENIFI